jgi:L-asparaginase/Glu-tRNA(Gln) amidotransferase subunit D
LPKVRVVATGGTIAGEQREPGTLGGYDIKKSVNEIVALIPNAEMGMLGIVTSSAAEFFYQPVRKHTVTSDFDIAKVEALPRVGISYSYAGAQGVSDPDAKAVIVTTTGLAPEEDKYFQALRKKGVIVATTFPSGEQVGSSLSSSESTLPPLVAVKHLMPTKARILMMLALTKAQKPADIQKIFDSY